MLRRGSFLAALCFVTAVTGALVALPARTSLALPATSSPTLTLARTIRTTPFVNNSSASLHDGEGSAYVPADNSLWLADDNGRAIYEVDPTTGYLKRMIGGSTFDAVERFGGGSSAGKYRDSDLESMAYDQAHDILYAFSGKCCSSSELPTVFRLLRVNGVFQLDSYQPLPSGSDFTASAWNPADGKIYVGVSGDLRTYDYASNSPGSSFHVSGLDGILGMSFSADGNDLFVARKSTRLSRVNWPNRSLVSGWTFDLSGFGVKDSRAVELINDQFHVLDGYDGRKSGDPLRYAVFVFDVHGSGTTTAPTASFTASPTSGPPPLSVSFTDTSTGSPTSWSWTFGDGGSSSDRNPSHTYPASGVYTATLTATDAGGSTSSSQQITVGDAPPSSSNLIGNPGFETVTSGWESGDTSVTLSRVTGGHSGSYAAKLTNASSGGYCKLNDHPNWISTTRAGTYTGTLWVRADTAGASLRLKMVEYKSGANVGSTNTTVTLSTFWQPVTLTYTPAAPGSSNLDFQAYTSNTPVGTCYYADDASITVT
jgi:PKD repeat protein